jgi:hypothetical protein
MRQTVAKGCYLLLTEVIAVYLVASPVAAFQLSSSSTGYVRVATSAAIGAYQTTQRAALTATIASVVTAPTAASLAVRMATGPVGWTLLGLSASLTLAQMYYSSTQIQSIKDATAHVAGYGYTYSGVTTQFALNEVAGVGVDIPNHPGNHCQYASIRGPVNVGTPPHGAGGLFLQQSFQFGDYWWWCAPASATVGNTSAGPATLQEVQTYVNNLPATDSKSIETNTQPVGQGVAVTPGANVTTLPVSPTDIVSTVKPAAQVAPTDAVIDPNAPPPSGPQTVTTPTNTTTTTTTTIAHPDGSTTTTDTEAPAVLSCSGGQHDQRTFGSVLQDHINLWQGSGLLSALTLLKTLSWPTTIPTYTLTSSLFGTFTLDFSAWSGMLTALRSLIIAIASFVAYRIVFVGGR